MKKITNSELESIGFVNHGKPYLWGDAEDIEYNQKTNELFYHSCVNGDTELYRKVKDFEDLKEALWFGFKYVLCPLCEKGTEMCECPQENYFDL